MKSCESSRPRNWPWRGPDRRSSPPPLSTKPTCGWWKVGRRPGRTSGATAATSSARPPRPCDASWLKVPAARSASSTAATGTAWTSRRAMCRCRRRSRSSPWTRPSPGWNTTTRWRPGWSSCISSPGCPSSRPPKRSASRGRQPTASGPTPGPGSAPPSRGNRPPEKKVKKTSGRETKRPAASHCKGMSTSEDTVSPEPGRVKEIFLAAVDLTAPGERATYLDQTCGGDTLLRQRVEALLEVHDRPAQLLDQPAAQYVAAEAAPATLDFLEPSTKPGALGRLGHYEVLEVIRQGGMGIVLRAFDEKLQRVVAVKVLAPALAGNGSSRQRFVREARAAAAVTHDNVIDIYAVDDAGPVPYLVMKCITGRTLQEKLDRSGPL